MAFAFTKDRQYQELPPRKVVPNYVKNVRNFSIGAGNLAIRVDKRGFWAGAVDKDAAPFQINVDGTTVP